VNLQLSLPKQKINLCPCCGSFATKAISAKNCYIMCYNFNCGLATKGWPNFEQATKVWNQRINNA
jgi:hypothetical protein